MIRAVVLKELRADRLAAQRARLLPPAALRTSEVAAPMPEDAPVTMQTAPSIFMISLFAAWSLQRSETPGEAKNGRRGLPNSHPNASRPRDPRCRGRSRSASREGRQLRAHSMGQLHCVLGGSCPDIAKQHALAKQRQPRARRIASLGQSRRLPA